MAEADAEELLRVYEQFNGQAPDGAPPAVQVRLHSHQLNLSAQRTPGTKTYFFMQKLFDEISESRAKSAAGQGGEEETETLYPKPECGPLHRASLVGHELVATRNCILNTRLLQVCGEDC